MYKIIEFFIRYKNTLLFLFLLSISLLLSIQTHSYQKSKFISSANEVTGGLYSWANNIDAYFHLKEDNKRLVEENRILHQKLLNALEHTTDSAYTDSTVFGERFRVYKAKVIANNYTKLDNYILIGSGRKDSISSELGVISGNGIVGVVEEVSANYARVISILNSNLSISAKLKSTGHFGTLRWRGRNPHLLQLIDIPKIAKVHKGDTVVTSGRSLIFPKGLPIGTVKKVKLSDDQNYYHIEVKLFNDMTSIGNVYVIRNNAAPELDSLLAPNE